MTYIIKKPFTTEHVCHQPDPYNEGVGTVWRCDNTYTLFGRVKTHGCGKHWAVFSTLTPGVLLSAHGLRQHHVWEEISWPPPPSGAASGTPARRKS